MDGGAVVVDARPIRSYASGHIPGALSIALRPSFATWLGWVVPPDLPLVLVLEHGQEAMVALHQALKVGYDQVAGTLAGGMAS